MNISLKNFFLLGLIGIVHIALPNTPTCEENSQYGKTYFHAREATTNLPLRMMGVSDKIHLYEKECELYSVFSTAIGFEQSRSNCGLNKVFSFNSSGSTLFNGDQGSNASDDININASASNARATDFGLSGTHAEILRFNPSISKIIIDFDLFVGLDEFITGLWARISGPIIHATYDLDPCSTATNRGGAFYPAGFVSNTTTPSPVPYSDIISAWQGQEAYGQVNLSEYGKLPCGSQSIARLGAVDIELGYDFVRNQCVRFGIGLLVVVPMGNSPDINSLFAPVAGTFNSQLGGTLGGHWVLRKCDEQSFTLFGKINMVHMFRSSSQRLFGLSGLGDDLVIGSSYLLLKKYELDGKALVYSGEVERAQNLLARKITVGNNFMADFALMLEYRRCNLDFSVGYNFWYRSKDDSGAGIGSPLVGNKINSSVYGIKGIAPVADGDRDLDNTFYSKSTSNIAKSGQVVTSQELDPQVPAIAEEYDYILESDVCKDIALAPSAHSNKLFGYIGYNWDDCDYTPYFGIGAMYEVASSNHAADQWGFYLKGGLTF